MLQSLKLSISVPWQIIRSALLIIKTPKLFALATIPGIIGLVSFVIGFVAAISYRYELSNLVGLDSNGWWQALASWLIAVLAIFFAAFFAYCTASILGVFAVDSLANEFLVVNNLKLREESDTSISKKIISIVSEICFLLILTLFGFITLVTSFIPPLALISLVLSMFLLGASFFSTALALLNTGFVARLSILFKLFLPCLTVGSLFMICLAIPFAGVIFLPVFTGAAVLLLSNSKITAGRK